MKPRLIATWYGVVALSTLLVLVFSLPDPDDAILFEHLEFAPISEKRSTLLQWRQVSLPDNWRISSSRLVDRGVYRGTFRTQADPGEPWAVHIPTFSSKLLLYVNGTLVGESLPYGAAPPLDQPLPMLARIPPSKLHNGDNELEIHLTAGGMKGGFLDRVIVGPEDQLRNHQSLRWFAAITVPQLLIVWEVVLAAGMFALWYGRPREPAYGLFCGILAWSILNGLPLILVDMPLPKGVWGRLGYLADIWQAFLAVPFAYHFLDRSPPIPLRWLLVPPILVTAATGLMAEPMFKLVVLTIILPFGLAALLWCVLVLALGAFRDGHAGAHLVTASLIAVLTFTVHDVLIIYNVIDTHITYLLRYSFLLVVTCISGLLLQRFLTSLNTVDHLHSSLAARIEDKEHQLRARFSALRMDERRRDLEEERTRLMRDMHDGVGGQLVSIISMAERQHQPASIADAARAALDDLRMIVASLEIGESDLSALLGMFRERIERQLTAADLDLDWRMTELPDIGGLDPSSALQILRILQEAVTNAVKHAEATQLRITIREQSLPAGDGVRIDVVDDGKGGVDKRRGGHGIANMLVRAEALDAEITIDSCRQGSRIRLVLPPRLAKAQIVDGAATAGYPLSMGYR